MHIAEEVNTWNGAEKRPRNQVKGYLCYKTITSQNVSSEAQVKNSFIS